MPPRWLGRGVSICSRYEQDLTSTTSCGFGCGRAVRRCGHRVPRMPLRATDVSAAPGEREGRPATAFESTLMIAGADLREATWRDRSAPFDVLDTSERWPALPARGGYSRCMAPLTTWHSDVRRRIGRPHLAVLGVAVLVGACASISGADESATPVGPRTRSLRLRARPRRRPRNERTLVAIVRRFQTHHDNEGRRWSSPRRRDAVRLEPDRAGCGRSGFHRRFSCNQIAAHLESHWLPDRSRNVSEAVVDGTTKVKAGQFVNTTRHRRTVR
jgi:hypothetical protein